MRSKIDRALYGPSWTEVIIGAVFSVLIGVVLAAAWLVFKPVVKVTELPKAPVAGDVYYIAGSDSSTRGRQWMRKRQLFTEGTTISLNEDELNTAMANLVPQSADKVDADKSAMLVPGGVNFRIRDGLLQIAAPVQLSVAGVQAKVQVNAQGVFVHKSSGFVFVPVRLYVGSCRVDRLPVVAGMILHRVMESVNVPPDLMASWDKLTDVAVAGDHLQLTMP
jgi:hypothetical protein